MPTQQQWSLRVGDGQDPEVFEQLGGMYELPEFMPKNLSTRDATTVDIANNSTTKKYRFNRQVDGQELTVVCDYEPGSTTQDRLAAQEGNDNGVNIQIEYRGTQRTQTWEFNALVQSSSMNFASSNDAEAVDQVSYSLRINSDVQLTDVAVA